MYQFPSPQTISGTEPSCITHTTTIFALSNTCAIKPHLNILNVCRITIHRAPTGNFALFLSKLDLILKKLYVIVGDININYLADSFRKSQLEALLLTYNLTSVVNFPIHIQLSSATATDNIFINITKIGDYSTYPVVNGQSDHDGQFITLHSFIFRPLTNKFKFE
jgi:hypothetical protein